MYNMFGVLSVASVTWFGKNTVLGSILDLVKIVIPAEIVDYLDFWPLLATCHQDDMYEIGRVVHVEHVWDAVRRFCDLVWAKTRSGVHSGLGENRDSGRNRRLSRFWATSGHLSPR